MTREEVEQKLREAIEQHFNSDGDSWSVAISKADEDEGLGIHNFLVTLTAPLKE